MDELDALPDAPPALNDSEEFLRSTEAYDACFRVWNKKMRGPGSGIECFGI
jgi:hypothetical protein